MVGSLFSLSVDDIEPPLTAPLAALQAMAARAVDLCGAMDDIGGMLVTSTLQRFEDETDPDGLDWPISARAAAENGQTLTDRGHLRHSITHIASQDSVRVGTNVVYGAIHQFGGVIEAKDGGHLVFAGRGGDVAFVQAVTIPARPYLGLSSADRAAAVLILEEYLMVGAS